MSTGSRFVLNDQGYRSAFRLALVVTVLAIAYLAFAPLDEPPVTSNDKLNHFLAFLVLAWLADRSFPAFYPKALVWGPLLGYGLLIELVQSFLPFRESSVVDFVADAVGILSYFLVFELLRATRSAKAIETRRESQRKA